MWQKMATLILADKEKNGHPFGFGRAQGTGHINFAASRWADNFWVMSHSKSPLEQIQDPDMHYESSKEGARMLKKECNPQTGPGGKMFTSTECRGEFSAEEWCNTSTASSVLEVQVGLGARKLSTEAKSKPLQNRKR